MKKVLIVEDEIITALELKSILERNGYEVAASAMSGEEAIQEASAKRPHLILMDIGLGGTIDGIETARQIRKKHSVPIIFISAYSSQNRIDEALSVAPGGYLLKPFEEKDLLSIIRRGLALKTV